MDISPDGTELFVFQSPVKLLPGEYQVQPTRIAVYETAAGIGAEPIRTFEAPRRAIMLMLSNHGSKIYALSSDIYVLHPQTGKEIGRHPLRTWQRANYSEPDVLDAWQSRDAGRRRPGARQPAPCPALSQEAALPFRGTTGWVRIPKPQ